MGVDLGDLCVKQPLRLEDLSGRIVAVDAYNTLYQFLATIRGPDGTPLMDDQGRVTSHLTGLLNRTGALVEAGVLPVFVFDGQPHPLKAATIAARSAVKVRAQEAYEQALKEGDLEKARSKAKQTSRLTSDMVRQAKELLGCLGVPCLDAPGEGEAQATRMVQEGQAYAVASQDYDAVLFGAPRLVRNLSVTGRRKMPGRQAWVDVEPEVIVLGDTLDALGLSREKLIDVAILIGTDFNPGVVGIGPKTALDLVREHGLLEDLLERSETETGSVWKKLRAGQEGLGDFEAVRNLFLQPKAVRAPDPKRGRLDEEGVRRILVGDHRFNEQRVATALQRYRTGAEGAKQRSLGDWG